MSDTYRGAWQHPPRLGRRRFLRGSAALAGTIGLSACGPVLGAAGGTPLRYWNLFGGGDGVRMLTMQEEFQKDFPDIDFQGVTLFWGAPYYTKLAMASAGGRAPDVAILHLARLPGFAPGSLVDPFDLDLLGEVGLREADFLPRLWERSQIDGDLFAVPLDSHPFVCFYNTDICERAGLLDGDGKLRTLEGADEVMEAFQAAADASGGLGLSAEATGAGIWRLFWGLYRQLDGQIELPAGGEIVIDDDKAVQALDFMRTLVSSGVTSPDLDYPAAVALFGDGQAGFHLNGEWEITTFQTAKLPFSMTRMPTVFDNGRTAGDAHVFVLPHQRDRDPERTRASYEFIAHLLGNSLEWAKGGHIPAYQPVATSQEYLDLEPQSEYRDAAEDMELDPPAWFSGSGAELSNQATAAFIGVYAGSVAPEQGLAQFKSAVNRLLSTPSPV